MKKLQMGMVFLLVILSACVHTDSNKLLAGAHYVNMGSSFAAGVGIRPVRSQAAERCGQSEANYASLVANILHLSLEDRSCSGATSSHLLKPWNELPPQIEAVNSKTRLVTITVGGNDLGYVRNLFAASCDEDNGFNIQGRKIPCFKERLPSEADYLNLENNMNEIARQIATRAPQATTIFVQYVTLIPKVQCAATGLTEDEAARLSLIAKRLSEITTAAAEKNGAKVLRIDTLSKDHTACDNEPWSTGIFQQNDNPQEVPWHPNRRGHEVIAEKLQQMLGQ